VIARAQRDARMRHEERRAHELPASLPARHLDEIGQPFAARHRDRIERAAPPCIEELNRSGCRPDAPIAFGVLDQKLHITDTLADGIDWATDQTSAAADAVTDGVSGAVDAIGGLF